MELALCGRLGRGAEEGRQDWKPSDPEMHLVGLVLGFEVFR